MAESLSSRLTAKAGPLPVWAWAVTIFGLGAGVYYYRKVRAANAVQPTTTDQTGSVGGNSVSPDAGIDPSTGTVDVGAGGSTGGQTAVPGANTVANNQQWLSAATSYLIGLGYPASEVTQGLNNWLLGIQASPQDTAMYNLAVAQWGLPPDGVPPQPTSTTQLPPHGGSTPPPPNGGSNPPPPNGGSAPGSNAIGKSNLTVSNVKASSVDLSFTGVQGAIVYEIYRNGGPSGVPNLHIGGTTSKTYHVTGLHGGMNYTFMVQARGGNGQVSESNRVSIKTPTK